MPRRPDPNLEARILNSAQKLWKKGGEKSLTMRAVARAAGTNTPTVYRRLRNRQGILQALLRRIQHDVAEAVRPYRFDRIYGGWWTPVLRSGGWETVRRSALRYIEHLNGTA